MEESKDELVSPHQTTKWSRDEDKALFKTICSHVLGLNDDSPLREAMKLAGMEGFIDLLTFPIPLIDQLVYFEATKAKGVARQPIPLGIHFKQYLGIFIQWTRQLKEQKGSNLTLEEWTRLDPFDFHAFRLSDLPRPEELFVQVKSPPSTPASGNQGGHTPPPSTPTVKTAADHVADFKKSIKRDGSVYPLLKDDKGFDAWNRSVIALARTHDVSEVFDVSYNPKNDDEYLLFDQKQSFVYSVFNRCVLTDQGKAFVREHESDFNAQEVYHKLITYARTSTAADNNKQQLNEYLVTARLDSRWRGSTQGFILHWKEQLRLLEDMTDLGEHYSPAVKRKMLEAAVQGIPELNDIKKLDALDVVKGAGHCQPLDYDQYGILLIAAAVDRDNRLKLPANRRDRAIQNLESSYGDHREYPDYGDPGPYTDVLDAEQYSANRAQQRRPQQRDRTFLPKEIWDKIPEEVRTMVREWDASKKADGKREPFQRKANTHDLFTPSDEDANDGHEDSGGFSNGNDNGDVTNGTKDDESNNDDSKLNSTVADLLSHITNQSPLPADHSLRAFLASTHKGRPEDKQRHVPLHQRPAPPTKESITIDGKRYVLQADLHDVIYRVAANETSQGKQASLIDRGANGGLAGSDVRVIEKSIRFADVSGINNHTLEGLPISTVAGVVETHTGPVCLIMHQYAYHGKGKTIHSSIQLEHFGNDVNDKSIKVKGGKQCITTLDGYAIPLQIRKGLAYLDMHPPSDDELADLPHVFITSDEEWNPSILDNELDLDQWLDARMEANDLPGINEYGDNSFDSQGYYRGDSNYRVDTLFFFDAYEDAPIETLDDVIDSIKYDANEHDTSSKDPQFELLRPLFAFAPTEIVKRTWAVTTRYARYIEKYSFKKHFKSRFPAANIHRRHEPVATDTIYSDTPAIDNGSKCAQIFVGTETLITDVYAMKSEKEFVHTLEDNIRKRGAMDKLISDRAQLEVSNKVLDILRNYVIDDWQSEPYHEHQNFAERRIQTIKGYTNKVLDRTGAPPYCWLLALTYSCFVLNHLATESLGWETPLFKLTGVRADISALLAFTFWEPVYYATADFLKYDGKPSFPSDTSEAKGRFVGIGESVGDVLTFKILTDDTKKVIYRSCVRSALNESERNKRLSPIGGEDDPTKPIKEILKMSREPDDTSGKPSKTSTYLFTPEEVLNRTYLTEPDEHGQRFRAKVVRKIEESDKALQEHPDRIKFLVSVEGDKADEIVAYNDILNYLEEQEEDNPDRFWKFKDIVAHEGPLKPGDPSYNGSNYNVMVEWEDGSKTFEPLAIFGADSPVVCAIYGRKMGLLDEPGWKRFKNIAKREKKMLRMANQAKLQSFRRAPIYQFGYRVPRTPQEAVLLDKENGNSNWQESMGLEMNQLQEYNTFTDLGKGAAAPAGYKRIRVHFVFAVKHDGRHKARLVADGHLTETPLESVYSGVVSLRSLRIVVFLAELNQLELWGADVGNAYLEAETREKVYIIGGLGFGDLEGNTLIIFKALYGLKSSGLRWHERLIDALRGEGFFQSKADPDVWMRVRLDGSIQELSGPRGADDGPPELLPPEPDKNGTKVDSQAANPNVDPPTSSKHYEYIGVHTDDLCIASKDPKQITDALEQRAGFKLKGVGPLTYHLGCDYTRDPDGTLSYGPKKYIEKLLGSYENMFKEKPKPASSPLEKGDHPEIDDSKELGAEGTTKYQSLIGAFQWTISLGRFDVLTPTMSMSSFRACPRIGHLDRLKRICGYLRKYKHGAIRVRVELPDYSDITDEEYDWMYTVYGNVQEAIPYDAPEPLGKEVITTTYEDANLYHDLVTGRAVTGILHFLNGTPIDWFSKKQDTVETATYGSEFVAARIATEQIIDLRTTLRYLGVPIKGRAYMFGDNQSVITSSTLPHSQLSKRHNALSYHRVREAIAAKIMRFLFISGADNPADILSKHCGFPQLWPHVQPLFFWMGSPLEPQHEESELVKKERLEI